MFAAGLVEEFRKLVAMGFQESDPGMRGIGYKEFFAMQKYALSFTELKELIKKNSRHYAKRQMTFFNSFTDVHWFDPADHSGITRCIAQFLNKEEIDGR